MRVPEVRLAAVFLTMAFVSPTLAENCQNARTTVEINECTGRIYKAADQRLNRAFQRAIARARDSDSNVLGVDYSYEEALRKAQRAWIAFRDADCKQPPPPLSGSIATMEELDCLTQKTLQRTKELERQGGD
ncbi:lysozyme inhibitor LprI family protein [Hyphomicrobium sp.]|uniref:lysozyme inhibitor LprI family protein n=1 Tax=Hyphomicrobium sp. TaxID=82 RepID=UPI002B5E473C|nr:lysozyme inhibitor LprI family protein [Hyphomicrobium sp.]HVZ05324.1 lysozyme inhibitor LprI family protein [Hyphomicrobium sp.]